jgi:hypothetical protein
MCDKQVHLAAFLLLLHVVVEIKLLEYTGQYNARLCLVSVAGPKMAQR